MKDWQPKVGDIVVRDPEYWKTATTDLLYEKRVISQVKAETIILDDGFERFYEYWMLDKNAIVTNILNDL